VFGLVYLGPREKSNISVRIQKGVSRRRSTRAPRDAGVGLARVEEQLHAQACTVVYGSPSAVEERASFSGHRQPGGALGQLGHLLLAQAVVSEVAQVCA